MSVSSLSLSRFVPLTFIPSLWFVSFDVSLFPHLFFSFPPSSSSLSLPRSSSLSFHSSQCICNKLLLHLLLSLILPFFLSFFFLPFPCLDEDEFNPKKQAGTKRKNEDGDDEEGEEGGDDSGSDDSSSEAESEDDGEEEEKKEKKEKKEKETNQSEWDRWMSWPFRR